MTPDALPFQLDDLLAERPWVRTLARSLVHDENAASDLEQETWLTALERPPRRGGALRGWLATVMRSRLADDRRSTGRRTAREERVATSATAPDPADLAARGELHRRVIEAVLALPTEQRDVVLLRYFEDRSAAEIATRYGVPASTVRSRLMRGLKRLREVLSDEFGAEGRDWRAALAPLAGLGDSSVTSSSHAAQAGVRKMSMTRLFTVGLAVVAALSVAYLAWPESGADEPVVADVEPAVDPARRSGPEGPRHTDPLAPTEEEPDPGRSTDDDPAPAEPSVDEEELMPGPVPFTLDAAVLNADGTPASGVSVRWIDAYAGKGPSASREPKTTDPHGQVQFLFEDSAYVRLLARGDGVAGITGLIEGQPGGAGKVEIRLGPTTTVEGRLQVAETGSPLAGVVRLHTKDEDQMIHYGGLRVGADGVFVFDGVPAAALRRGLALEGYAKGHQPGWMGWEPIDASSTRPTSFELKLNPAAQARGRCVDVDGRPIQGIDVSPVQGSGRVTTDADGRFEIHGLDAAKLALLFETESYVPQQVVPEAGEGDWVEVGDVVFRVGATLRGRVLYSDGRPAGNCSLNLYSEAADQFIRYGGTEDDGTFELRHLGDHPHMLYISSQSGDAPHGVSETAEVEGLVPRDEPYELRLRLGAMFVAELRVAETGAVVSTTSAGIKLLRDGELVQNTGTHGDDLSEVTVVAEKPGRYDVEIRARGYEPLLLRDVDIDDNAVTRRVVELSPRAR